MKILHTADIHLDWKFSGIHDPSKRRHRHQEHRDVFRRIIEVGLQEQIEAMFIVGDVFEQSSFSLDTIRFIQRELERLRPTPVFIVPGNHDPLIQGSPYLLDGWGEHVYIFQENRFTSYALDEHNAVIYGIAHTTYQDERNYLQAFQIESESKLNILLLHGSDLHTVPENQSEGAYFPFTRADLHQCRADYIALGHYHTCRFIPPEEQPIAAYPGSPEGMGFSELGERYVLVGEITKSRNQLRKVQVNQREYRELEWDCTGCTTREDALDGLRQAIESQKLVAHILRIQLIGTISPEMDLDLPLMQEMLSEHCFQAVFVNKTSLQWDLDALSSQRNVRGEFVRRMVEMIQGANEAEKECYQTAMNYGLESLSTKREVILRL
ncbi:DNA repair exonuclease [Candidatus Poribacteria bacterium]|nr:DNA repair exonuclease [Candidatus Poribacteria bacterium]